MPETSPWDEIAVPGTDFNVRQVAAKMAVPVPGPMPMLPEQKMAAAAAAGDKPSAERTG